MSIRSKLIFLFLGCCLLPLVFITFLTFRNYERSMRGEVFAHLQSIADLKAENIEAYFASIKADLGIIQADHSVRKNFSICARFAGEPSASETAVATKILDEILQKATRVWRLSAIILLDLDGDPIYASHPRHFEEDFLKELAERQRKIHEGQDEGAFISDVLVHEPSRQHLAVRATAPLLDPDGLPIGWIVFEADLAPFYRMIQDVTGLGKTGETLIGKKLGDQVIFLNPLRHDPRAALERRIRLGDALGGPIQKAIQEPRGVGADIDYRGREVVAAWRHIPTLDWGLVAKIDRREAFADIRRLRNQVAVFLVVVIALSGFLALSLMRSISKPLQRLTRGTEIIGNGNWEYQIGSSSNDEIGQLSRAFDQMSGKLKKFSAAAIAERKRLFEVLETLPVYVVLLSEGCKEVSFANKFFREHFGKDHGRRCYECIFNQRDRCENCEIFQTLRSGRPYFGEWTGPDGRDYEVHALPFTDTDGARLVLEIGIDITDRKRAEAELAEHRAHLEDLVRERTAQAESKKAELQTILDSVPAMIFYKDKENRFIRTNKKFEEMMGLPKQQLEGRSVFDLYPKEQAEAYWQDDRAVLASGQPKYGIVEAMEARGERKIVSTNKVPYVNEKGEMIGIIGFSVDITEIKRAEEALWKSQQDLSHAQAVAHVGSWRLDMRRNVLTWSEENHRIFGVPLGAPMSYETFMECVHPEDREFVDREWKAGLTGKPYEVEHRIVVSGHVKWVREKAYLEFDEHGKFTGGFGITQDITDRKHAEEALRQAHERLVLAQQAARAGIWDWDLKTGELTWSPEFFFLFGLDPSSRESSFEVWKKALHPEDRAAAEAKIDQAIRDRIPLQNEYRIVLPGGEVRWISAMGNTLYDDHGQPKRMTGICIDITDRKKAEEILKRDKETFEKLVQERTDELFRAQTELERAKRLSDIGALAATVAHELRTPLGAIRIASYNIKQKAPGPLLEKHLIHIEKKVAESDQIINNLLFYSRIRKPVWEEADLFDLLEECIEAVKHGAGEHAIEWVKNYENIRGKVFKFDPFQVKEVCHNILINAVDAVSNKNGRIVVGAGYENEGREVAVRFEDNGCGISRENLSKIHEPFFTTKTKGTGLGLTVCQQIVANHGGRIDVASEEGKGTTITVVLPVLGESGPP
ncbi:MAG: PAS domain S-box protein [Candidatus Omnitrophota bacterium]